MNTSTPMPIAARSQSLKQRIFVIEDHTLMRRSIIAALERESDLTVCGEAMDMPEALAAIAKSKPDLVLTDVQLKSSSGLDLIRKLRASSPKLPIVATTMFDVRRTERLARDAGASGFAGKQDGPEQLIATVREALKPAGELH